MIKISVLMSVYREYSYIEYAINSILDQTFDKFEFIIIDDSVDEKIRKLLTDFKKRDKRIKLIVNKENIGLTKSLNKGLNISKGEYIARMDADDIAHPERLRLQLDFLESHKNVGLVGSFAKIIDSSGNYIGKIRLEFNEKRIKNLIFFRNQFVHSSVMMQKKCIESVGGYNEQLEYAQDHELWLRIIKKYDAANIPLFLISLRMHPLSITSKNNINQRKTGIKIISRHIYRKFDITLQQFIIGNLCIFKNLCMILFSENTRIDLRNRRWGIE